MDNTITFDKVKKVEDHNNKLEYYICTINEKDYSVPLDLANRHYAEIKRQVDAGELTIEDAD